MNVWYYMELSSLSNIYRIAGNFRGRKLCEFRVFVTIREVFSVKFGGVASFGAAKASNLQKFSPQKLYFLTNLRKFSPSKVSRYTVSYAGGSSKHLHVALHRTSVKLGRLNSNRR